MTPMCEGGTLRVTLKLPCTMDHVLLEAGASIVSDSCHLLHADVRQNLHRAWMGAPMKSWGVTTAMEEWRGTGTGTKDDIAADAHRQTMERLKAVLGLPEDQISADERPPREAMFASCTPRSEARSAVDAAAAAICSHDEIPKALKRACAAVSMKQEEDKRLPFRLDDDG